MNKWDKRFMELAENVGKWSSCVRRQIGAITVKDKRILTTGYNGAPAGVKSCVERGVCIRDEMKIASGTRAEICYAVHAEQNAICQAAYVGVSLNGATLYCTHRPCTICTKMIINAGIKRVVYKYDYPDEFADRVVQESDVVFEKYND